MNAVDERTSASLFGAHGWHVERDILDRSAVEEARAFLEARLAGLQARFQGWVDGERVEAGDYALHQRNVDDYVARGLPMDLRHFLTGEFDLETRLDRKICRLLAAPTCRSAISRFLGSPQYFVHYPPMLRFKVAAAPVNLVPVHQDRAYNRHMKDFITIWVPLVDIDEACGGVIVYEGSHVDVVLPHQQSGAWAEKAIGDFSRFEARHVTMKAGDALLFPPTLLHESAPHRSPVVRYSIDFRVFRHATDTTKSYYDPFEDRVVRPKE